MAARTAGFVAAALLALTALAGGCSRGPEGERRMTLPGQLAPVEDDRESGFAFDQEIQKQLPLIHDLEVLEFVDRLGQRLVDNLGDQPFDYRFRVLPDPSLNAFAVPGGYIYFHSGTILEAGSVEELAGVLAHELGHVKGRHSARMAKDTAIPSLLATVAGLAASAAAGDATPMLAAQAANVAIQLQYSRQYEDEADRLGVDFLARSGLRSEGLVRFFERIQVEQRKLPPGQVPPYLYSHPQVEDRIEVVRDSAQRVQPGAPPPAELERAFRATQQRLVWLVRNKRAAMPADPRFDRALAEPALAEAERLRAAGLPGDALAALDAAERASPEDPRIPYRRAELLESQGRLEDAIAGYRRAVHLDPNQAATLLALGRAERSAGRRREALFFLEQASFRAGHTGRARAQIDGEIERLVFPVLTGSGFAAGDAAEDDDTILAASDPALPPGAGRLAWWGRLGPHWRGRASYFRVRWRDAGGVAGEARSADRARGHLLARRDLEQGEASRPWTLELLYGDEVVHRETIEPPGSSSPPAGVATPR
ncbi:MAG TPA: M48 family metalloprotease [Myxococcota bacterium]|nr:M48 family metalloprotease [Myxococcota bacterium]